MREFVQHRVKISHFLFSQLQYQSDLQNSKGKVTVVQDTPEILRVKENQKNFSSVWSPLSSLLSPKKYSLKSLIKLQFFGASPTGTVNLAGLYKVFFPDVFVGWLPSFTGTAVTELDNPSLNEYNYCPFPLCCSHASPSLSCCPSCSVCLSCCPVPVAIKSPVAFCLQHHLQSTKWKIFV